MLRYGVAKVAQDSLKTRANKLRGIAKYPFLRYGNLQTKIPFYWANHYGIPARLDNSQAHLTTHTSRVLRYLGLYQLILGEV